MEIMQLRPEQKKQAAGVVAAAFYDYEQMVHYFPDTNRRTRWLPWYMERVLNTALSLGEVLTTGDLSGVMFVLPPGHTRPSTRDYALNGFRLAPFVVGLRRFPGVTRCEDYVADAQERLMAGRPHYYLWGLVADPKKQRAGAGTALLRELLKKADAEKLPVFLETHKALNVPYYEQRGFKMIYTDVIPKHDLRFWCLLHEPPGDAGD
jgi:GNAT superfamily N-acetyltransferase